MDRPVPAASLTLQPDSNTSLTELPASRGVLCLFDQHDTAILVMATANVRETARRKLAPPGEGKSLRGVEFRAIARRADAYASRSHFEGRLLELDLARALMPETYRNSFHRMQTWFVALHPDADPPRLEYLPTHKLDEAIAGPPSPLLLGPIRDKHKAGRAVEQIVDIFELCRFPAELARAPEGTACVYKEMGRCPAACDGSEPLDAYRMRMRESVDMVRHPDAWREQERDVMGRAAGAQDFEAAGRIKRRLEEAERLLGDAGRRWMRVMRETPLLIAAAGDVADEAFLLLLTFGTLHDLGSVGSDHEPDEIVRTATAFANRASGSLDRAGADRLTLVCNWMYANRRGAAFEFWEPGDPIDPVALIRAAHKGSADDDPDAEVYLREGSEGSERV